MSVRGPVYSVAGLSPNLGEEAGEARRRLGGSALGPEITCTGTVSETQAYPNTPKATTHSSLPPAPTFPRCQFQSFVCS